MSILWKAIALAVGAIGLFWAGARNARIKADLRNAKDYAKQRRAQDEALEAMGDDPDVLRDWLRERGQR